jgi:hypothetical protein
MRHSAVDADIEVEAKGETLSMALLCAWATLAGDTTTFPICCGYGTVVSVPLSASGKTLTCF